MFHKWSFCQQLKRGVYGLYLPHVDRKAPTPFLKQKTPWTALLVSPTWAAGRAAIHWPPSVGVLLLTIAGAGRFRIGLSLRQCFRGWRERASGGRGRNLTDGELRMQFGRATDVERTHYHARMYLCVYLNLYLKK